MKGLKATWQSTFNTNDNITSRNIGIYTCMPITKDNADIVSSSYRNQYIYFLIESLTDNDFLLFQEQVWLNSSGQIYSSLVFFYNALLWGVNNLNCQDWSLVSNQYFASVIRLIRSAKKPPHNCLLTINSSSQPKIYLGTFF